MLRNVEGLHFLCILFVDGMFFAIGQLISEKDHHVRGCVLTDMYSYPLNPLSTLLMTTNIFLIWRDLIVCTASAFPLSLHFLHILHYYCSGYCA